MTKLLLLSALLFAASISYAQSPGSGGPTPGATPDPTAVPLDAGSSLLLASGVAYGVRRLRQRMAQRRLVK